MEDEEQANIFRDALDAGLRYYGRLGRLALEGGAIFVPALRELSPKVVASQAPPSARRAERTVLLEPAAGKPGLGVFLVENLTADPVSAEIAVSPLSGPAGEQVAPALRFSPETIALRAGRPGARPGRCRGRRGARARRPLPGRSASRPLGHSRADRRAPAARRGRGMSAAEAAQRSAWSLPELLGLTADLGRLHELLQEWVETCDPEVREMVRRQLSGRRSTSGR